MAMRSGWATGATAGGERFWVAVIPLTWVSTTLSQRRVGDAINLEADLLAKYTERLITPHGVSAAINRGWLSEHGWG
jgi:riboflavin synthase